MNKTFSYPIKARYNETDQMGVVYHANYIVWLNCARDAYLEHIGVNIKKAEKAGYLMPVISVQCDYLKPVFYGDEVVICVVLDSTVATKFTFLYEIKHARRKTILAKGKTVSVIADKQMNVLLEIPDVLIPNFEEIKKND
jgi:acyl-CoA thioester hydrolase